MTVRIYNKETYEADYYHDVKEVHEGLIDFVLLWTSLDGGKTFYHCGVGKYCKTLEEAEEYKQQEEAKQ